MGRAEAIPGGIGISSVAAVISRRTTVTDTKKDTKFDPTKATQDPDPEIDLGKDDEPAEEPEEGAEEAPAEEGDEEAEENTGTVIPQPGSADYNNARAAARV
jgi:hypothetical protein